MDISSDSLSDEIEDLDVSKEGQLIVENISLNNRNMINFLMPTTVPS